ncbi:MAG TPA: hypothetical protein VJ572_05240, partial [Azonexus sp.]|nr:hypothetical protein [Azonexus sp.]
MPLARDAPSLGRDTIYFFGGCSMSPDGKSPASWPRPLWQYGTAFLGVAVAAGLRVWPLQALGSQLAWLTFYPAVMIAAIYGGWLAGLLAVGLSVLVVMLGWPLLVAQPFVHDTAGYLGMAIFGLN